MSTKVNNNNRLTNLTNRKYIKYAQYNNNHSSYCNSCLFIEFDAPRPKLWRSCRISIAFCIFLASVQMAMLRDNLGLALVCMSKPTGNLSCDTSDAVVPTFPWLANKKV